MRPRTLALVLLCLLTVSAGCSVPFLGGPPEATVENERDDPLRVVAYTVSTDDPAGLAFHATPPNEPRQVRSLYDVFWSVGYRNVSMVREDATTHPFTVAPGESVTTTLDGWTPGDVTVYLVETLGGEVLDVDVVQCDKRGQSHSITAVSERSFESSSYCG